MLKMIVSDKSGTPSLPSNSSSTITFFYGKRKTANLNIQSTIYYGAFTMKSRKSLAMNVLLALITMGSIAWLYQDREIPVKDKIAGFVTVATVIFSVYTFKSSSDHDQTWKTREFVAQIMKEFEEKAETINVRKMINTESQLIDLFPTSTPASNRFVYIDDQTLNNALRNDYNYNKKLCAAQKRYQKETKSKPDYARKNEQKLVDAAIRDNFNRFAESLQLFEAMIQSEVVTEEELAPYLKPLFKIIYLVSERPTCTNFLPYFGLNNEEVKEAILNENKSISSLSEVQQNIKRLAKRYDSKKSQNKKVNILQHSLKTLCL